MYVLQRGASCLRVSLTDFRRTEVPFILSMLGLYILVLPLCYLIYHHMSGIGQVPCNWPKFKTFDITSYYVTKHQPMLQPMRVSIILKVAADACSRVSVMFFGPWTVPARKTPFITVSTVLSFKSFS